MLPVIGGAGADSVQNDGHLPAANIEGSHSAPERTLQTTPLATTVRPYAPGDSFNRIHWKSTARHGEIQVKEFDLEQTSDVWLFLDLDRRVQAGKGDESTVEVAVRAAASIADRGLLENRAVGITTNGHRAAVLPADRGGRQHLKIMQLLAAVDGDGTSPLSEALVATVPRIRRGMTAVVITPSLERDWVKPLAALRSRGVGCVVVSFDVADFEQFARDEELRLHGLPPEPIDPVAEAARTQRVRALRHALSEFDVEVHTAHPAHSLGEALAS